MSKLDIVVDSTQISDFLYCERYWNYSDKERLAPLEAKLSSDAALMGTYGHSLLETYYKSIAAGNSNEKAFIEMLDATELAGLENLCLEKKTQVRERCKEYLYIYNDKSRDFIPCSPEHVEVGFSECIYEDFNVRYILEGRIDLIGSLQGMPCIADHKFQMTTRNLYKKSIQFRNYAMIAKSNTLVINLIRLGRVVNDRTFERAIAQFAPAEHLAWRDELIAIFDRIAHSVREADYAPNWSSCKFNYNTYQDTCPYVNLCEITEQDADLIRAKKETLYQLKPEWKPW